MTTQGQLPWLVFATPVQVEIALLSRKKLIVPDGATGVRALLPTFNTAVKVTEALTEEPLGDEELMEMVAAKGFTV